MLVGLVGRCQRGGVETAGDRVCCGCGKVSPPTPTDYSLISPRYGWRLLRKKNPDESYLFEWYCPKCWAVLKGTGEAGSPR